MRPLEQLTGLDALFLYLETDNAPMHIGGVSILDVNTPYGRLDFATFRRLLAARLGASKVFRQKLTNVPLNLGKPYWIEDADFHIDRHLERTQLPEPGGNREVAALASWEFAHPLDRSQPLWQFVWAEGVDGIEGVPPGSVALISKIHHAAIDGVSGAEILGALFDLEPKAPPAEEPQPQGTPEADAGEVPSPLELLGRAGRGLLQLGKAYPGTVKETVQGLARSGAVWGRHRIKPPPLPFAAPRTRLNTHIDRERTWGCEILPLDRLKALRKATEFDATLNDVVLAICAGALRAYLLEKDDLPEKPLVAMVPISVRTADKKGAMGNEVSAMLVPLATDEADPLKRLERIHRDAAGAKVHHQAIGATTLADYSQFIPFSVAGMASRLYTRMELADKHRPIFNLVITNVPGPQQPLYIGGARLLAHAGMAPIFDGLGLILPIFSFDGKLSIGALSSRNILPDMERFTAGLRESLEALEGAVGGSLPRR
jgi:diacylglycerol O-acyltransferase / wax synthase